MIWLLCCINFTFFYNFTTFVKYEEVNNNIFNLFQSSNKKKELMEEAVIKQRKCFFVPQWNR